MAIARVTKITASSPTGFREAVDEGFWRAKQTLRDITGLEVVSRVAKVANSEITEYRSTIEVTFVLD